MTQVSPMKANPHDNMDEYTNNTTNNNKKKCFNIFKKWRFKYVVPSNTGTTIKNMTPIPECNISSNISTTERDELECAICLEKMTAATSHICNCGHSFHWSCIEKVRTTHMSWKTCKCPLCRAPMYSDDDMPNDWGIDFREIKFKQFYKKQVELKLKLPWYRSHRITKIEEAEIIFDTIRYQRLYCRKDPRFPNHLLQDMELSPAELLLIYHCKPVEDLYKDFGITNEALVRWLVEFDDSNESLTIRESYSALREFESRATKWPYQCCSSQKHF